MSKRTFILIYGLYGHLPIDQSISATKLCCILNRMDLFVTGDFGNSNNRDGFGIQKLMVERFSLSCIQMTKLLNEKLTSVTEFFYSCKNVKVIITNICIWVESYRVMYWNYHHHHIRGPFTMIREYYHCFNDISISHFIS